MHVDYTKICRVCMSKGSRDIFEKSIDNGNPLQRLLEKLRYVTMMKIDENDDLPRLLCDLCIVQLNVAYNFKRQAIENDTKLRQYCIENGITSSQTTVSHINESSPHAVVFNEPCTSSVRSSVVASNVVTVLPQQKNNLPVKPIIVKVEPTDDIALNIEKSELTSTTHSVVPSNKSPPRGMVYLNCYNFNNLTPTSDVEILNQNDTSNIEASSTESDNVNNQKPDSSNDTLIHNVTNKFICNGDNQSNPSDTRKQLAKKRLGGQLKTRYMPEKKKVTHEVRKLSINMVAPMGKLSRHEMKKNLDYTSLFHPSQNKNTRPSNSKSSNRQLNKKNNISNKKVVLNPFNESGELKGKGRTSKKCRKQIALLTPKIELDNIS